VVHGAVVHGAVVHGAVVHGAVVHGAVVHGAVVHGAVVHGASPSRLPCVVNIRKVVASVKFFARKFLCQILIKLL